MMLCGNRKRLGAIISIPIIIAFMTVMGNIPSVVRAGIMQIIILLAPLLGRESDSPTSISLALAVILAVNPTASKNAGLQFSFAATAGILMFAEPIRSWLLFTLFNKKAFKNKIFEKLANFISSSISVSIGGCIFTVPLSALYFGYISIIAPISNLLVLWLISLVFTGGMVCTLFGFIWTELGRIAASALTYIIRLVKNISFALSKVPFSAIYTESLYLLVWLLTAYIIFAIFLLSRKDKNKHKNVFVSVCAVAITLIAALAAAGLIAASPALTAAILDVGQGESIVLSSGSDTIIVDCGGNDFEGAGKTAANYICSQSKFRAKLLVLTHFHADHANGVKELLNLIDVKTIAVPELVDKESEYYRDEVISIAKNKNIDILYIREDTKVLFGDAVLSIYAPIGTGGENEVGLSILCSDGDYDILITGDMSGAIEKRLIMTHELPDIEVLIVGHHGSKNSTSDELLDELKPEIAVISVGYNSYGHPSNEVLERLYSRNIEVYRTDVNGNVEIKNVAA